MLTEVYFIRCEFIISSGLQKLYVPGEYADLENEIAEKLEISVGTSKSQFNRARILLQKGVADLGLNRN